MRIISGTIPLFLLLIFIVSCSDEKTETTQEVNVDIGDLEVQRALDIKHRYDKDSLLILLDHEDPTMRYIAVSAFDSWKETTMVDTLIRRLAMEPNSAVKQSIIRTLGNFGDSKALSVLIDQFASQDTSNLEQEILAETLQAVGKTGDSSHLDLITKVTTYEGKPILKLGQAKAVYRFMLRDIESPEGYLLMMENALIPDNHELSTISGQYFLKSKRKPTANEQSLLYQIVRENKSVAVRNNVMLHLSKTQNPELLEYLKSELLEDNSTRSEQLCMLDALENYPLKDLYALIPSLAKSEDPRIRWEAAELYPKTGSYGFGKFFLEQSFKENIWEVQTNLQDAVNRYTWNPRSFRALNASLLRKNIASASNTCEKIAYISALSSYPAGLGQVIRGIEVDTNARIQKAYLEVLVEYAKKDKLKTTENMKSLVQQLVTSGDPTKSAISAWMLLESEKLRELFTEEELAAFREGLDPLLEIEAYMYLGDAKAKYSGENFVYENKILAGTKAINWDLIVGNGERPQIEMVTSKGKIVIELFPEKAPGTVGNFLELVEGGFYTNKTFHRVVSNFVVQAGCPVGTGYGAGDFTIPTETTGLSWDRKGLVGMASIGRNTESTQFFISLGPTLHLDAGYTLFGEVTEGLEVLDLIDEGDLIKTANIVKQENDESNNTEPEA